MSSYNRIPKDSVSFSAESTVLDIQLPVFNRIVEEIEVDIKEPEQTEQEIQEEFIKQKESELHAKEIELNNIQEEIQKKYNRLLKEQATFEEKKNTTLQQFEYQKREDYYQMRKFMWNQAIEIAQEVVHQSIDIKQLSIKKMFDGLIEQLPIELDELSVTVHPFTLEYINAEETQEAWVLHDIKWKLDYSLEIGDFVLETQSEFYDGQLSVLFKEIKQRIERKYLGQKEGDSI